MATPVDECTDAAIDSVLVSFLKEEQREMLGGQELFSFVAVIGQNKSLVGVHKFLLHPIKSKYCTKCSSFPEQITLEQNQIDGVENSFE